MPNLNRPSSDVSTFTVYHEQSGVNVIITIVGDFRQFAAKKLAFIL
jgi:hypothetical protein